MDNQKISMPTEAEKQRAIARILDAGLPRRVAFGRELREVLQRIGPPRAAVWRGGLFGLVPADLGPVPAVGAFCGRFHRLFGTGPVPVFSPALCRPLPADCLEEPADRHLGVDLDLPGLRPDGGGPADAVLRRGVRTGVCPGKYAVVDLHRAGDAPWAGCWHCLWPACFCMALSPCCASGCGDLPGGWRRRPAGF